MKTKFSIEKKRIVKKNSTEKDNENHLTTFRCCWRLDVAGRGCSVWFYALLISVQSYTAQIRGFYVSRRDIERFQSKLSGFKMTLSVGWGIKMPKSLFVDLSNCPLRGYLFYLRNHRQSIHDWSILCAVFIYSFFWKKDLKLHLIANHVEYPCDPCDYLAVDSNVLNLYWKRGGCKILLNCPLQGMSEGTIQDFSVKNVFFYRQTPLPLKKTVYESRRVICDPENTLNHIFIFHSTEMIKYKK